MFNGGVNVCVTFLNVLRNIENQLIARLLQENATSLQDRSRNTAFIVFKR